MNWSAPAIVILDCIILGLAALIGALVARDLFRKSQLSSGAGEARTGEGQGAGRRRSPAAWRGGR